MPNTIEQLSSAADAYAEALLPLAQRDGVFVDILAELEHAAAMFRRETEIRAWFDSPLVSKVLKADVIERAFRGHVSDLTCDVLGVVTRHERMGWLDEIVRAFRLRVLGAQGRVEAHVTTAAALSDRARASIQRALAKRLGADPVVVEHVDSDILGGLVVRVGDEVIDVSVQNELAQINQAVARWMDRMIVQPMPEPDVEAESQ